jgi:hypothetical protein
VEVLHLSFSDREYQEYYETACDQYEWHGEVYTESGDYTFNTISSSGCERTEVLHLTIFYSEHEEYNITACDSYEWHGKTYTESGDYEYRTTITHVAEKLYVGYNAQNDPIIGLTPPRGISRFTVDGYITEGSGCCFVGTGSPENGIVDPEGSLRIFDAGSFYYDRMSGRNSGFFDDYREPFNIEFGNYYAKNLETGEYYFNEGNNVYEYSNTEYPLTLFYNDYGKIHKVQFFDNNNLLWADINAVIEGGVPMITIDYYNPDGSIYHTQQFTENLHAETKTITVQGGERVEILHLTIYTQTLPSRITLPTVRVGKSIDLTIQNREIREHISQETWYAPNAKVQWYIMQGTDWITLTDEPVSEGVKEVVLKYVVETDCGIVESDNIVIVVSTDLEHIQDNTQNIYKIIRDNKIFIIRGGKAYSIMGHLVGDKSVIESREYEKRLEE